MEKEASHKKTSICESSVYPNLSHTSGNMFDNALTHIGAWLFVHTVTLQSTRVTNPRLPLGKLRGIWGLSGGKLFFVPPIQNFSEGK